MQTYVALMKLTDQGIKDVRNAPSRIEAAVKGLESAGGSLKAFYAVMGEYDYVAVAEAPDDETVMGYMLGLGAAGNVRTTTLRAFDKKQFSTMVEKVPIML